MTDGGYRERSATEAGTCKRHLTAIGVDGLALTALELHRPVCFPGAAAVTREGLLPPRIAARIGVPGEANPDGQPLQRVVGIEHTDVIGESPHHRNVEAVRRTPVDPPDGPRLRCRVKGTKGRRTHLLLRKAEQVVFDIAEPTEDFPRGRYALELSPLGAPCEARVQPTVMHPPVADDEIEVRGGYHWIGGQHKRLGR